MRYTTEIINISDGRSIREYNEFVNSHVNGNFFQASEWRNVKSDWKSEIIVVRDNGKIVGGALILIKRLPFLPLNMLYVPRGPVCDYDNEMILGLMLTALTACAKRYHACIMRLDPLIEDDDITTRFFQNSGFMLRKNPMDYATVQTRNNYILPLTGRTKDEVFESFHSKWRYNIRLAIRKGVMCEFYDGTADNYLSALHEFHELLKITGRRDGFTVREMPYYRMMLEALGENCRLYICRYNGEAVSGAITVQYGGKTHYVYGASSNEHRTVMPNYLMQWEMIKWALESGNDYYDFMGIPFYWDENHPNYGVYRFKKGFNGRVISYAGEFDYICTPLLGHILKMYLIKNCSIRRNSSLRLQ